MWFDDMITGFHEAAFQPENAAIFQLVPNEQNFKPARRRLSAGLINPCGSGYLDISPILHIDEVGATIFFFQDSVALRGIGGGTAAVDASPSVIDELLLEHQNAINDHVLGAAHLKTMFVFADDVGID